MEDGNGVYEKLDSTDTFNLQNELSAKLTTNGYDCVRDSPGPYNRQIKANIDVALSDNLKKRVNPLKIHLGKRPFIDNSSQFVSVKKKPYENTNDLKSTKNPVPRLIPKKLDKEHNVASTFENDSLPYGHVQTMPRMPPKQLSHIKKGKIEKGPQNAYTQNMALQPTVKFKCRKCSSMSFKTLGMLKDHQRICRAEVREPALSPEAPSSCDKATGGPSRVTKKVYLCSACGTYYENWNLFLHMREMHNRHICLFCLGMFSKADKLSSHLVNKHDVIEHSYSKSEEFFEFHKGALYLMCCSCEEIYSEKDDFLNHDCNNIKPKPVPMLVSKNATKLNGSKQVNRINCETSINGPLCGMNNNKVNNNDFKLDNVKYNTETTTDVTTPLQLTLDENRTSETNKSISSNSDSTNVNNDSDSVNTSNETKSEDSGIRLPSSAVTGSSSPLETNSELNDDESLKLSPVTNVSELAGINLSNTPKQEPRCTPREKEKDCGIKLKLSLNNVNSPVIINSTVDPTVGKQIPNKPPVRSRRPPKRYEKESSKIMKNSDHTSVNFKNCYRESSNFKTYSDSDNSFDKLSESNQNINLNKSENPNIKSTIYDNKPDDMDSFNRVPKLTVRVPKELLDKDSSSDYSSDSNMSNKLTVDENSAITESTKEDETAITPNEAPLQEIDTKINENADDLKDVDNMEAETTAPVATSVEKSSEEHNHPVDEIPLLELSLDKPLDKYSLKDLLKVFVSSTMYNCIYCNHVRKIAVNCEQLSLHMVAQHRFTATVDSITAEELLPETISAKVKAGSEELASIYVNLDSYDSVDKLDLVAYDHLYECFQCYFKTTIHKDLYVHNRKMHQKTILLCVMCKSNFYSYSELLCHLCPGTYDLDCEIKFRCCLCSVDTIPSSFRLMVHLRKMHNACDVCLESCHNQSRLSNHVWKHKLHHVCYRCGIAYRNKPDITKHLFWKHGTESVMCKKCLQKKWPHVYHFCIPPASFLCEECNLNFSRAICLRVHKRLHTGDYPHICQEEGCTEKFISKKLLLKHVEQHKECLVTVKDVNGNPANAPEVDKKEETNEPVSVDDSQEGPKLESEGSQVKSEISLSKKKKKHKDKDSLLLDVNLPALNLSESDSSDESDNGAQATVADDIKAENPDKVITDDLLHTKVIEKNEPVEEEKASTEQVLEIWDNFTKYQAKVEKQEKQKSPPLVPIRKHVCESDHDYCLIPSEINGDFGVTSPGKKAKKKSLKKKGDGLSSSSSSSSDSDSSCSCGSNCSCSSSSGSSSSSSSDTDSSLSAKGKKKKKTQKKGLSNRRKSGGSQTSAIDVMSTEGVIKREPPIAESDLETDETETDEEFYDEHPQRLANKLYAEKRNQLMLLASVAPSDTGSLSGDASRGVSPIKDEIVKDKHPGNKKKTKKKKRSKNLSKNASLKINIPKEIIPELNVDSAVNTPLVPNRITISLHSNTVQIPDISKTTTTATNTGKSETTENKRASKRRRIPNKFYGYSSDEEIPQPALKPQLPPKLEWRKEDLPSPTVSHKMKKDIPSSTISNKFYNYTEPIFRLSTPIPDPVPPPILMNTESMESSESDSSTEGTLKICQPKVTHNPIPVPPPHILSGTSSLPYPFQRPSGFRQAREGESVYCYCRCPYDEVSEMIACDAEGCAIEWFHFECVGIMVPPKGKWYCPECRQNQNISSNR